MKRIIFLITVILLVFPLFADIRADDGWKPGDSDNTYSFKVKFTGAEYADVGFSKTMTTYSKGSGLAKNEFDNKSVTLNETAHDSSSYSYASSDTYYIYWYLSLTQALTLDLDVEASDAENTITVSVETYTYKWSRSSFKTTKGSATPKSSDTSATTVASFPACYMVIQGNSAFTVTAVVKKYPESRRIGTLKLTLRTTS